jgi:heme oxygenase (biliverdin-IX-beta and delta-forming)
MAVFVVAERVTVEAALPAPQAFAASSILSRLRLETRGEHDAVERVLGLMGSALTRDVYLERLAQFYGFYGPLEAALQARCALPHDRNVEATCPIAALLPRLNKTALLRQDLRHLRANTKHLPLCAALPPTQTLAQVLGCVYVMEGATLGGRLITLHVQATLGITPTTGGSFFEGYASDTAKMWQAMRQQLVSGAVDVQTEDAIVVSAMATFSSLRHWCERASGLANCGTENQKNEAKQYA